jgi:hypothetical protein
MKENVKFLDQSQMLIRLGQPEAIEKSLQTIQFAYPLKLEWDLKTTTNKVRVHPICAKNLRYASQLILSEYGTKQIEIMKLDHFSGGFNIRVKRGGNTLSAHSFGIAFDFFAAKNGLKTPFKESAFSQPAYAPFLDIMEVCGFYNYGRHRNFDSMHFEFIPRF